MKNITLFFTSGIMFLAFLFSVCNSNAQISEGGTPITFSEEYTHLVKDNIPTYKLPFVDNEGQMRIVEEMVRGCEDCKKNYWGTGFDVNIQFKEVAKYQQTTDGHNLWLYQIESDNAYSLQIYFRKFKLPNGARLFLYNEDRSMILGAFTSSNNKQHEKLALQPIKGKSIIVEYFEPQNPDFAGELIISNLIHDFKGLFGGKGPFGNSGSCEVNVACPEGDGWEDEISSVAIILYYNWINQLAAICSGALINNTNEDGIPYFLTANHCADGIGSPYEYWNWVFLFNHESSTCSGTTAQITQSVSGSTLLSNGTSSDYLLLLLDNTPPDSYYVCYSGWNKSSSTSTSVVWGIHHPAGDIKKISIDYSTPTQSYWSLACLCYTHWKVNDWDVGSTTGGSSGSPLFDTDHRIIGQDHLGSGDPECDPNKDTHYGKFSRSWSDGNFEVWLDPANTGTTTLDTYNPPNCIECPNYDIIIAPITTWQNHSSSHDSYGCKTYRLIVASDITYIFKTGCGDGATADYDTQLELYNSGCALIASNDDGCENYRSKIEWTANYSGYAYLKVKGYLSEYGNYTLAHKQETLIPYSPSWLTASANSSSSITIAWEDVSNESGYKIFSSSSPTGAYSQIGTTGTNQNSYTDNGLNPNTQYCYKVKAFNTAGDSDFSPYDCATTFNTGTPPNDDCTNATIINEVTNLPFNTDNATASGIQPSCGGSSTPPLDIWYAYTATQTGTALIDLCGSIFDTRLTIWDSCNGNEIACNDDDGPACSGLQSSIEMAVTNGTTFYIQVGGFSTHSGEGNLSIQVNSTIVLDIKVFLEGAFNGLDLNTYLTTNIPLLQPYNIAPWFYNGDESVSSIPSANIVDWVLVELRDAPGDASSASCETEISKRAGFILNNGDIVDLDGTSELQFSNIEYNNNLYCLIWHRNHLGILSNNTLIEIDGKYGYDFTTSMNMTYGGAMAVKELEPGIFGMVGGDADASGLIDLSDRANVWHLQSGESGYLMSDINLDVQVNNIDKNELLYLNNGFTCQVPGHITSIIFEDDFESYSVGSFPPSWVPDGNATNGSTNYIDDTYSFEGNQSIKLYGTLGGCWGALAYHSIEDTPPYIVELAIRNSNENLSGCHPDRGQIGLRAGTHWSNPSRGFLLFDGDGNIYSGGSALLVPYNTEEWYLVKIKYEIISGSEIKLSYWVNNNFITDEVLPIHTYEDQLDHFELASQEGSVWFDNVSIKEVPCGATNTPPTAFFTVDPPAGETGTIFTFDASGSTDPEDPISALQFRWDWDGNGDWDTPWSGNYIESYTYSNSGTYSATLEVKDSGELVDSLTIDVVVINVIFDDDFESYSVGSFPLSWVPDGNATNGSTNYVDDTYSFEGNQSLKLYGTLGGCWGALAYHSIEDIPPYFVELAIRNSNESLSGCHPDRGDVGLRNGTHWSNPSRGFLLFDGDEKIYSGGGTELLPYNTEEWYFIKIKYEIISGSEVKLSYWVNNNFITDEILSIHTYENQLDHLQIAAQEGSVWFDNIKVYKE